MATENKTKKVEHTEVSIDTYVHTHTHTHIYISMEVSAARPDFAELYVFLGQHILLTLEQHFNPKM